MTQVGDIRMKEDCSKKYTCQADGTFTESAAEPCHEFASCKRGKCKCNRGFIGDGVNKCESMSSSLERNESVWADPGGGRSLPPQQDQVLSFLHTFR